MFTTTDFLHKLTEGITTQVLLVTISKCLLGLLVLNAICDIWGQKNDMVNEIH